MKKQKTFTTEIALRNKHILVYDDDGQMEYEIEQFLRRTKVRTGDKIKFTVTVQRG